MWALTDFTEANGATRLVPGSHLAPASPDLAHLRLGPGRDAKGSVLVWVGSLWHGGGANPTDERRVGHRHELLRRLHPTTGEPAAGTAARHWSGPSPRLQELVGYGVYNGLIGHIDKQIPANLLLHGSEDTHLLWDYAEPTS